jgi:hypothetical protein
MDLAVGGEYAGDGRRESPNGNAGVEMAGKWDMRWMMSWKTYQMAP